jgi:catechol 2,3-dioxygenase-like lactoylglutathione lyase family enzyme
MELATASGTTKLTGISPQFLVDDLARAIEYYTQRLGFALDFQYEDFYASVSRDGCAIHLKEAPKNEADRPHRQQNEHLDAYIGVSSAAALYDELGSRGALITKALEDRPWSCRDFYVQDPDGYILCFSERTA